MRTIINALIVGGLLVSGSMSSTGDELIRAVENGDSALLSRLIAKGADVNYVDDRGYSAMILAAAKGQADSVTILIDSGVSVNQEAQTDFVFRTALLEATSHKQTEVVRLLIQNGADVNQAVPELSYTALHIAASNGDENGDSEIVSILLENNANVNLLSSVAGLYSPLYAAARFVNARIVSKLLRAGADVDLVVNDDGETALMVASSSAYCLLAEEPRIFRRWMDTIALLIQAGANINAVSKVGYTALFNAVGESGADQVGFLVAHGANVNQETAQGTPLMKAIEQDNFHKVRLLVLAGAETGNLPGNHFREFTDLSISYLQELLTHRSSLISTAYVKLKESEQEEKMFKNAAFRDLFNEWDDLRIDMVSCILSFLATLETEDLHVTYILAPFLANADMERLNRFGLVLSFLTAPFDTKTKIFEIMKCADGPELIRFIRATFRYAIIMASIQQSLDSFIDPMYAVYSNLIADFGAIQNGLRRIVDVNIGTVYQFRHGEFGIYSKFAKYLQEMLI